MWSGCCKSSLARWRRKVSWTTNLYRSFSRNRNRKPHRSWLVCILEVEGRLVQSSFVIERQVSLVRILCQPWCPICMWHMDPHVDLSLQIQAAQRKMLRWLVGLRRETEEPWIDFIKRSTHISERLAREHGVPDWLDTHRSRKWKLAGTVARRTDIRWSKRLLGWKPHFRTIPYRDVGRPCLRWSDAIADVAGGDWAKAVADEGLWMALSYAFRRQLE